MKIICLQGGLGNQMFQYAFYRYMMKRGFVVRLDASSKSLNDHTGFELLRVFPNIKIENKTNSYAVRRIKHIIFSNLQKHRFGFVAKDEASDLRERTFSEWLYYGYWQQYAYINEMREELMNDFYFTSLDENNVEAAEQMQRAASVSVHIRRGDYTTGKIFSGICTADYYSAAVKLIENKIKNPVFFVFSDDVEWVRKNIVIPQAQYIDKNSGTNSFRDMQLMSLCKHNIIANSSFSWWGAWLNANVNKTVILPKKWSNINLPINLNIAEWIDL
ncbi:MAG: alpha-1,2-fucosyltransferase [Prevotellaceae bacterium]|jgi:hypothetical protein|nr:alpha-1,2-fucosyltransferase [Prevotellaceae bacterium]